MNSIRRNHLSLVSLALAAPFLGGCAYPFRETLNVHMTAPAQDLKRIDLTTRNGTIEIIGEANRRDVDVSATRSARGASSADARQHAEQVVIKTERNPDERSVLRVDAIMPSPDYGRSYAADFRLTTPADMALELTTSNGRVTVKGTNGRVRISTSNGRIAVSHVAGPLSATTSNGEISIADVGGDLDLRSSNGRIEIVRSGAASIRAVTSNGDVDVTAAKGNADVRSSNGSIALRLIAAPAPLDVRASTSNGRVLVEVPCESAARLEMSTSNGAIRTDFEAASVRDLHSGRSRLSATLNNGGGRIDVNSSNGSLTFRTIKIQPERG